MKLFRFIVIVSMLVLMEFHHCESYVLRINREVKKVDIPCEEKFEPPTTTAAPPTDSTGIVTTEEPDSTQETTATGEITQPENGSPWPVVAIIIGVLVVLAALSIVGYIYSDEIRNLLSPSDEHQYP